MRNLLRIALSLLLLCVSLSGQAQQNCIYKDSFCNGCDGFPNFNQGYFLQSQSPKRCVECFTFCSSFGLVAGDGSDASTQCSPDVARANAALLDKSMLYWIDGWQRTALDLAAVNPVIADSLQLFDARAAKVIDRTRHSFASTKLPTYQSVVTYAQQGDSAAVEERMAPLPQGHTVRVVYDTTTLPGGQLEVHFTSGEYDQSRALVKKLGPGVTLLLSTTDTAIATDIIPNVSKPVARTVVTSWRAD